MRAIQLQEFGGAEAMQLVELPDPEPGDGEVVIEVARAGINFADTHVTRNDYLAEQELPLIPGGEVAGRTPDGRRVAVLLPNGGYAEKVAVPEAVLVPVPDEVSDEQAAGLLLQGLTARSLLRISAHLEEGESVVVEAAAGGTGSLAVQLAKRMGAGRVIALASSEEKRELTRRLGADVAVDSRADDLQSAILDANGGEPVDVVLEMSGGAAFEACLRTLAPFGRLVTYGLASREPVEVRNADLMRTSRAVVGFWLMHLFGRPQELRAGIAELLEAVAKGELEVVIGGTYPLSEARRAHEEISARTTHGKLLLDPESVSRFADLGLSEEILTALDELGYSDPTAIQEQAIPELLAGRDVIGQAQTGTGKTAAFGLPMLQYLDPESEETQALVLTPTRELCIQVTQALRAYAEHLDVGVIAVFGGQAVKTQQSRLREAAHVVVATVGRTLDLISRGSLNLASARYVVLDEADEMLDLGFIDDVERILRICPSGRQTSLFSATIPPPIERLSDRYMYDPVTIRVTPKQLTVEAIEQAYVESQPREKVDRLIEVLKAEEPEQAIIFCRTKIGTARLDEALRARGLQVKALHGDLSQGQRDGVMLAFKDHRLRLLVATDVAARGLDIEHVTHVINYDVPDTTEAYIHRIGRTGRVGRTGRAITFVTAKQRDEIPRIEREAKTTIGEWEPPEERLEHAPRPRRREHEPAPSGASGPEPAPGNGLVKLFVNRGRRSGIDDEDVRWALVEGAVIPEDAIGSIRVLDRFSFVELDAEHAALALERLEGTKLKGKQIRVEYARG